MILDGKVVAAHIKQQLKEEVDDAIKRGLRPPRLVIITVGDDPASEVYVRNKKKACDEIGIQVEHIVCEASINSELLKTIIVENNFKYDVDGIMVQLPLPKGFDEREIIDTISPLKDVDGLTTTNIGRLRSGQPCLCPCTAQGIVDLLDYYSIPLDGKDATIVGRSNIVGKPLADLLMQRGMTITQCHSHTETLIPHTRFADILICAIGKPNYIKDYMVNEFATVIDVGINRNKEDKLCGDVDFEKVSEKCTNITPVPGGVGPMTVAELMKNTVEAWRKNIY